MEGGCVCVHVCGVVCGCMVYECVCVCTVYEYTSVCVGVSVVYEYTCVCVCVCVCGVSVWYMSVCVWCGVWVYGI